MSTKTPATVTLPVVDDVTLASVGETITEPVGLVTVSGIEPVDPVPVTLVERPEETRQRLGRAVRVVRFKNGDTVGHVKIMAELRVGGVPWWVVSIDREKNTLMIVSLRPPPPHYVASKGPAEFLCTKPEYERLLRQGARNLEKAFS